MLLNAKELASLGPEPRQGREPLEILDEKIAHAFSKINLSPSSQQLIRSLVLLWHDHLDESHSISQNLHSADGSFLHGIMHRREPDYGNAKYWFHRVGEHPCYPALAIKAAALIDRAENGALKSQLLPGGDWDAFGFVDACEKALRRKDAKAIATLQAAQEIEFKMLLDHFLGSLG